MARKLLTKGVDQVRILFRDEMLQDAVCRELQDPRIHFYVVDIRGLRSVDDAIKGAHTPAAAL